MSLFMIPAKAVKAKFTVDDILKWCGAEVIDSDEPRAVYYGWGNEFFLPVFKPLYKHLSGLTNNTNDYLCVYSSFSSFQKDHSKGCIG